MRVFRRLLSLFLILLVWACQTNDPQVQPDSGQVQNGSRVTGKQNQKLKKRTYKKQEGSVTNNRIEEEDLPPDEGGGGGGPSPYEIAEANTIIDEIQQGDDEYTLSETNALVAEANAMDDLTFITEWNRIIEVLRRFSAYYACKPDRRSQIASIFSTPSSHSFEAAPFLAVSGNGRTVRWNGNGGGAFIMFGEQSNLRFIIGCGTDDQAHHIIPSQWTFATTSGSIKHPVIQKAALNGFHPNDGYNGVCLPTTQHHNHPTYNRYVKFQLDQYQAAGNNSPIIPADANKWLQCRLIPHLRGLIRQMPTGDNLPTMNTFFEPYDPNAHTVTFIGIF